MSVRKALLSSDPELFFRTCADSHLLSAQADAPNAPTSFSKTISALTMFNRANIAKYGSTAPAGTKVPDPRVVLFLGHSETDLVDLKAAGIPGYSLTIPQFKNAFLSGFSTISDFAAVEFSPDDDPAYCMTYGRFASHLRRFNAFLARKMLAGGSCQDFRVLFATDLVLLDSWHPSTDVAVVFELLRILASYGCSLPRVIHLSRGPQVSAGGGSERSQSEGVVDGPLISLSWARRTIPKEAVSSHWGSGSGGGSGSGSGSGSGNLGQKTDSVVGIASTADEDLGILVEKAAEHLLATAASASGDANYGAGTGAVYIVVPDNTVASAIRNRCSGTLLQHNWTFDPSGPGLKVHTIFFSALYNTTMSNPEHLIIVPVRRIARGYLHLTEANVCCAISKLGSTFNSTGKPVRVYVPSVGTEGNTAGWQNVGLWKLLSRFPSDARENASLLLENAPMTEQLRIVCQLASSSVQTGTLLPVATELAMKKRLIEGSVRTGRAAIVQRVLPEGVFCARTALDPELIRVLVAWNSSKYGPFPGICLVAVMERVMQERSPVIVADPELVLRIAKENEITDLVSHQLFIAAEYVREFRAEVVSVSTASNLALKYGADPVALMQLMARIFSIRASFVTNTHTYGPFRVNSFAKALAGLNIFPIANYQAATSTGGAVGPSYTIGGEITQYKLPLGPYTMPQNVMILNSELEAKVSGWERNAVPVRKVRLYIAC